MNELERVLMTLSCGDCEAIPKVAEAGRTISFMGQDVQIMHNGVKVIHGGYHGDWMAHIIRGLRGHHEPQEELIFHTMLKYVRNKGTIAELGAFWAYYTQWFLQEIPGAKAICVEPDVNNLSVGMCNAALNDTSQRIRFINAWIGGDAKPVHSAITESSQTATELPMLNFPTLLEWCPDKKIELLHMDTQGAEEPFLSSITPDRAKDSVRFIMVSTHHSSISGSQYTHQNCLDQIRRLGATILAEHDVIESYSGDGLIAASFFKEDANLQFPDLSRNRAETSLFGSA